jgi:hypothetical protein
MYQQNINKASIDRMTGIAESMIILTIFICVMAREWFKLAYED